jgi:DNA-binding protein YbaB
MDELAAAGRALEQRLRSAEAYLVTTEVRGSSDDGTVSVCANGLGKLRSVQVDPAAFVTADPEALAEAIAQAIRSAAANATALARQRMGPVEINLY